MKPVMISRLNTVSRQCAPAVPGPPVFSTGMALPTYPAPNVELNVDLACVPMKYGSEVPAPPSKDSSDHIVPKPIACPSSCVAITVPPVEMLAAWVVFQKKVATTGK